MSVQMASALQRESHLSENVSNIQDRLIAPCNEIDAQGVVSIDISALLNRLLIFENYYLQSIRLREFASLVRNLGVANVVLLLNSGAVKIDLNPTQFGQSGQTDPKVGIREKPPLPLLSYSFSLLRSAQYNDYLFRSIQGVHRDLRDVLSMQDTLDMEGAILRAITPPPENVGASAMLAFDGELRCNAPILKKALVSRLSQRPGFESIDDSSIFLAMHPIDETDFSTESNLESLGLTKEDAHKILESSLLAVGKLNSRIEDMETYQALSGAIDGELPLFGEKLNFLAASLSPKRKQEIFDRVLSVGRFPSFHFHKPTKNFDMPRFLKIRESNECREFRHWLRGAASLKEKEIHTQVASLHAKLGNFVHEKKGKAIRVALGYAAGLIQPLGLVGLAVSAIDSFLLEKVLPLSGPAMFLDEMYGSLFTQRDAVSTPVIAQIRPNSV